MSQCHALTKDLSLCRNFGEVLEENTDTITYSGFCHIHRLPKVTPKQLYKLARHMEWSTGRCTHITYLLEEEVVEVKKEDFAKLSADNNYTYFVLLCARYVKGFHRDWNPFLFDNAATYLWEWRNAIGPVTITFEDFHTLAAVSSWDIVAKRCPLNEHTEKSWRDWLWKYFETEEGKAYLFDMKLYDSVEDVKGWLNTKQRPYEEIFITMMDLSKKVARTKCRVRTNKIREDLMRITWHPDRVVDWCFDEEDKELLCFFGI